MKNMKVPFETIFEVKGGEISNKVAFRCSGMTAKAGAFRAPVERCAIFGGINFSLFLGRDLEIKQDGDYFVIRGIY
jgi:hypothetical protein